MKAAVLYRQQKIEEYPLTIEEVNIQTPKKGEVLIKVLSTGTCHSDLHVIEGRTPVPLPCVPGHEIYGVVENVGPDVTTVNPGDYVVASFIWPCGKCHNCITGKENLCEVAAAVRIKGVLLDGTSRLTLSDGRPVYAFLGGGFAEYVIVPEFGVKTLPQKLRKESSAILGCAILTAYGAVIETGDIKIGESVAVFGAGGVGINIIQLCKIMNASQIIAVDIIKKKLEWSKEFGATNVINSHEEDPVKTIKELTEGKGVDIAFEVVGLPNTISQAVESVKVGGRVVLVGLMPVGSMAPIHAARIVRGGLQVLGSYGGRPRTALPKIFNLIERGLLKIDEQVMRKWKLDEINQAFLSLARGEFIRSIIVPTS
ncbi:MAG: zinc-binding dehydrogenase [Nitrososphaerota archaeon]